MVSDRFAAQNPQTMIKFAEGWLEGVQFIKSQPARAYTLIGSIKDFNIPTDLAKTMLEGVVLADAAENKAFFGSAGAASDYSRIFKAAQQMYQETGVLKGAPTDPESSVDRKVVAAW